MTGRFHLCSLSLLMAAAFTVLPSALHARAVTRGPLNGASLGGMTAGTVTNLPFTAQAGDEAYGEILAAIRRGAPSLLERVLSNYAHTPRYLDTRLNYMETPVIFHAISELKLEHTDLLIRYGSIVNFQLPDTQFRKFQKIAAHPIDAKQTIKGSCTPLAYVCFIPTLTASQKRDTLALAKLLMTCGADCNLPGFEGKVPVQILCENDRMDILKYLLSTKQVEFKSDVLAEYMRTHKEDEGVKLLNAYMLEREADKQKNADAARKAKKPGFTGKPTLTFNAAVLTDNSSEIRKHLGTMDDVDDPLDEEDNKYRQTPLIRAVELGKPVAVRLILDSGADPNHPDATTCTPLVYANMKGVEEVTNLLTAFGATLPVCPDIETAAKQDRPDEIERIFNEATARKQKTAPMLAQGVIAALQLEREQAFAKLIKLGANPNQIKVKDQVPLVFALIDRNLDAFLLDCKEASTPVDLKVRHPLVKLPPMLYAASGTKTSPEVIQALVKLGAGANSYGPKHKTALMYAAESGNKAVVDALLKAGADPKATDSDGRTYLDYDK
jgi:ankyrin repeat protein